MNKLLISIVAASVASSVFAQGPGGGRGQGGQNRVQVVSIPENVLRANLPLDSTKLDALIAEAKVFQASGLPVAAMSELKLTTEQKKKIDEIVKASADKARELMRDGDRDGAMELRKQVGDKVSALLTADQKKVVEKYPAGRGQGGRGGRGQIL